jgi:hypothetical protein
MNPVYVALIQPIRFRPLVGGAGAAHVGGLKQAGIFGAHGPAGVPSMDVACRFLDLKYHDIPNTVAGASVQQPGSACRS